MLPNKPQLSCPFSTGTSLLLFYHIQTTAQTRTSITAVALLLDSNYNSFSQGTKYLNPCTCENAFFMSFKFFFGRIFVMFTIQYLTNKAQYKPNSITTFVS
jgi:hypothetical protein